jgi:hypothetical protein
MTYYFIGTEALITGYPQLTRFGQKIDLPDDVASEVRKKVALLTADQWQMLGFTEKELGTFSNVGVHEAAPPEFIAKRDKAWTIYGEWQKAQAEAAPPWEDAPSSEEEHPASN